MMKRGVEEKEREEVKRRIERIQLYEREFNIISF